MLLVRIHNDGTGTLETGHYDWEVLITETPTTLNLLARGRIENFPRALGWRALLKTIVEEPHESRQGDPRTRRGTRPVAPADRPA